MTQPKSKSPFYELNKAYSITINPDDHHQGLICKTSHSRLVHVKQLVENIFEPFEEDIRYILHLDISEPREIIKNYPRIHFHGAILFDNLKGIRDFLLVVLRKLSVMGYVDIDTCDDKKTWSKYCKKYDHITNMSPIQNRLAWTTE